MTVHIHSYSVRAGGGGGGDVYRFVIVPHRVTNSIGADQTPGLIVPSKQTVVSVSFPADPSVSHRYVKSSTPLDLPVGATGQTVTTQKLRPVVKPVWMIRIRLILVHVWHLPVVVRQPDLSVYCVCVERELTWIWWREEDTAQLQLFVRHLNDSLSDVTVSRWLVFMNQIKKHTYTSSALASTIWLHQAPLWKKEGGGQKPEIATVPLNLLRRKLRVGW